MVAKSISIDDMDEDGQFSVWSQTTPTHAYHIDVKAYTCDFNAYLLISYCKHLVAVQLHYYEDIDIQPVQSLFMRTSYSSTHEPGDAVPVSMQSPAPNMDHAILASIPEKLQ